jgi:SAM-dependent methyltransferase
MAASLRDHLRQRRFARMLSSLSRVGLLRTGFQLGLFEALREPQSGERLADRLGLAPELVDAWLRAAQSHGLLSRSHGRGGGEYRLGGLARWLLEAPESESLLAWLDLAVESYGPSLERLPALMQGAELPEFGSVPDMERAVAGARLFEQRALEALRRIPGARAARRLLDIGCGDGSYLTAFLLRHREAHALGIERHPEIAERALVRFREAGIDRRAELRVGDFTSMDLPEGCFDLVLLNHTLHYFGEDEHEALFRRALDHLCPGGVLAVLIPVLTRHPAARAAGLSEVMAAFDLFLRGHRNLHGLPDLLELRAVLERVGFASVGETPVLPGGSLVYLWGARAG